MGSESAGGAVLLSQSAEAFQKVSIGGADIVISVLDVLSIGEGTDFPHDYSGKALYLYAEALIVSGLFELHSGIVSTELLLSMGNASCLSTAGRPGGDAVGANENPAVKGSRGGNGAPGGALAIYLGFDEASAPTFSVSACGGAGGAGQTGLLNSPGGDGGDGGAGANVVFLAGVVSLAWIGQLERIIALNSLAAQQTALSNLLTGRPTDTSSLQWKRALDLLAAALSPLIDSGSFRKHVVGAAMSLQLVSQQYAAAALNTVDISGGRYGVAGLGLPLVDKENQNKGDDDQRGGKLADNGTTGQNGIRSVVVFGTPADLCDKSFPTIFFIHPSQCARLLNKIELMYLVLDPITNPDAEVEIISLLIRLEKRTELFAKAPTGSALAAYYRDNEKRFGAVDSLQQFRDIHNKVGKYLDQIASGQDIFGCERSTTPLGSFVFYTRILDRAVADFAALQQVYDTYFAALKTNTSTVDQVREARLQQNQIILTAKEQNVELARIAEATAGIINGYQTVLPALQIALQGQLDALGDAIEKNRDFNLRTVLQCLTTLAFAPESKFMMIVQGSTLLYDRFNTVTSVQGVPVEKDYIVKQLVGIEASVSGLEEGFSQLRNGTLEPQDPGAGKLIAEETAFLQFMSQFDACFPEELASVKEAFDAYVSSIVQRNNELLTYNSALQLISRNEEAIMSAQSRMNALDDETLDTLSPQLPDLVSYVSGVYYASRNQVLATLDQAARAYRFWALSNRNLMIESLGDKAPPQINAATLLGAKNTILKAYEQAVETFGTGAENFPEKGKGLVIEIPSEDLEDFRKSGLLFVRPKTVRQTTSKADSVFAAMANVRVNSVRVWIHGATTSDGDITVSITHTGKEEIVAPNGNMYSFAHAPVTKLFKYHTNCDTGHRTIQEEANFGLLQQIGDGQKIYAAIGPFTSWFIQVRTQNHVKLDLRKTTAVQIEFSGSNYAFNTSR